SAFEMANEAAVIVKATVDRNAGNRFIAVLKAVTGDQYPQPNMVLRRTDTKGFCKTPLKLALGKTKTFGNIRNTEALGVVRANILNNLKYRTLRVVEHPLIALHNSAQPADLAPEVKQRQLLGDKPFRQPFARGKQLDQVQQRRSVTQHRFIIAAKFGRHVGGKECFVALPVKLRR